MVSHLIAVKALLAAGVAGAILMACSHAPKPSATPAFESSIPPLGSAFAELGSGKPGRDVCQDLLGAAELQVGDLDHGAAIVLKPRGGHSADQVRDAATLVEQTFLPGVRTSERGSCKIFEAKEEVTVRLATADGALRLEFQTFDEKAETGVKDKVRAFVDAHKR